jgi:ABC-type nickel/cobalt efflux system permease component RcnA
MHSHHHTHKPDEEKHKLDHLLQPGLHKNWRTWLVIGLMLASIAIYVLSLDDSVQSRNLPQPGVPATAVPR